MHIIYFNFNQELIMVIRIVVILILTIAAFLNDRNHYKISNRLVFVGLWSGILLLFISFISGGAYIDLILGGTLSFALYYACYLFHGIGAGDTKLLSVIGLIGGLTLMKSLTVVIALLSITACAIVMIRNRGCKRTIRLANGECVKLHIFHFSYVVLAAEIICFSYIMLTIF